MLGRNPLFCRVVLAGLAIWLGLGGLARAQGLPGPVAEALAKHQIPLRDISLYVREAGSSGPSLVVNAEVPRNPASVMKVVTTFAALDSLGPAYTWRTEALVNGKLAHGRLNGDLIIKGYGDPDLTPEDLWSLVHGLQERGVKTVAGDLVLDGSYFAPPEAERGDFDGKADRAYNALPDALSVNFQVTDIHLYPDRAAGSVRVFTSPPLANVELEKNIRLVKAPCRNRYHKPLLMVADSGTEATVKVAGTFAADCHETSFTRLILNPEEHLAGAVESLWGESGGKIAGKIRSGEAPEGAHRIYRLESRPLADVVRSINKWSNNLMCRSLLLTLGAERYGAPGSEAKGQNAVKDWLHRHHLQFPELVLNNGSGLSREGRISAAHLGDLLTHAYRSPLMPELVSSLAIAGVDGTMRRRLVGLPVAGRAHIKTGTLNNVSTMAGYVLDRNDRRWVVVMMINHKGLMAWQGRQVQDRLISWVYAGNLDGAAGRTPSRTPAKRGRSRRHARKRKTAKEAG